MSALHQFSRVDFLRFKAFKQFRLDIKRFNVLVGPNNAGKSTVIAAFRILSAAMRHAGARKAKPVQGKDGITFGYDVDLTTISIAEENIFFNYDNSEDAFIEFTLSNKNTLSLFFPRDGGCKLIPFAKGKRIDTPSQFKKHFNCPIGFVPILGPVEHREQLYEKDAARLALFNYKAARNFRNIWYHYPTQFEEFRLAVRQTWPGMDIQAPEIDTSYQKPTLYMYCPEQRMPRELFWSGFGFQVWCQMLTHVINAKDKSIFLIDEPDIYLHADLQRQLVSTLRDLGPDIILATHSTEIIMEADTGDIVIVNKIKPTARRIKNPSQLADIFNVLGSNTNPILTQLAKTKRVLFVEGNDFHILGKFARKLKISNVGNQRDFAVVPLEGFNPERMRNLKTGMETTLGTKIIAMAILDRDYRSDEECEVITKECAAFCDYVEIHKRKEIENFLLVPSAIDRAIAKKLNENNQRSGSSTAYREGVGKSIEQFASEKKSYIMAQFIEFRKRFIKHSSRSMHETTINERSIAEFDNIWRTENMKINLVPGKEAVGWLNKKFQDEYHASVTPASIIDAMKPDEIPTDMSDLIKKISLFSLA